MTNNGKVAALVGATLFIIGWMGWYFESPAWTLHEMKAAADANGADALSSYVDYPALREDLKAQMTAQMFAQAQKDKSGLGAFGLAIGSAVVGPMIDSFVSPAGVRAAFIARRNQQPMQGLAAAVPQMRVPVSPIIVRKSFSEFILTSQNHPDGGMIFKLHGLTWKLSGVELPRRAERGSAEQA